MSSEDRGQVKVRRFDAHDSMISEVASLLRDELTFSAVHPHAVVLPGGATPLPVYKRIEQTPFPADENAYIVISDERYVSKTSSFYNYSQLDGMVQALGVKEDQVLNVDTTLEFNSSAEDFDRRLTSFMGNGGVIRLALLGLGSDGHTASLFSRRDLRESEGRYAVPITANEGPDRISVTPDLIEQSERVIVMAAGASKRGIVSQLEECPRKVVAGRILAKHSNAEIWYSEGGK